MLNSFLDFLHTTAFTQVNWQMLVMWAVVAVLLYLAVAKGFEPLLLVPIAFGALIANLPTQGVINEPAGPIHAPAAGQVVEWRVQLGQSVKEGDVLALLRLEVEGQVVERELVAHAHGEILTLPVAAGADFRNGQVLIELYSLEPGGLFYYLSRGIHWEIFPPLIFLGVGALTDFGPLIARPMTLLLGAAAQLGVAATFIGAALLGFNDREAASIGIIGGADGPTAIFLASKLSPHLLSAIAVAAYSYMSLVPLIQPPIMRLLTTPAERTIRMKSMRKVSRTEKLVFALLVAVVCILLVPAASSLIAMLMLGNFLRECGVTERLSQAAQNEVINVITIFLGTSVGMTMTGSAFLRGETIKIIVLGVVAFGVATAGGILMAKFMNLFLRHDRINPLIGSAGVSAVPMAARVSHVEGQRYDSGNYLLMHAMGPNVAGVIGTAVLAGFYLATLGAR